MELVLAPTCLFALACRFLVSADFPVSSLACGIWLLVKMDSLLLAGAGFSHPHEAVGVILRIPLS